VHLVGTLALAGLQLRQIGIDLNDSEEVVEVVGDPGGQHADRLHLLGLQQLGLQLPFLVGRAALAPAHRRVRQLPAHDG
jgi:hypothetical protein